MITSDGYWMTRSERLTIGILAHVDAGKTTLSEAILYRTGELRRLGRVDHKDTFLDDNAIERNRGITVFSKQARFTLGRPDSDEGNVDITLIDTPGHVDFAAEMERSLSVIDYALLVVSGSEGVQAHTRTLLRMLSERGIPVFMFVNKMDISVRKKTDIISELSCELGCGAVDFTEAARGGLSALDREEADRLIDSVTLYSPELAEKALSDESDGTWVPEDADIAVAVSRCEIVPCVFGSALRLEGVDELLDVISRYSITPSYSDEFGAKIYKVQTAEDGSRLTFARITGGTLRVRDIVKLSAASGDSDDKTYKINQIRLYSGSKYTAADEAPAGTVCAVTGIPGASPGDALGSETPSDEMSIRPFMVYTVSGPEGMDPYLVMKDLELLSQEDPALSIRRRPVTGEIEIRLMGQVQLEVIRTVVRDRFGYDIEFGSGRVLYLETIDDTFEGVGHFEPLRHYAEVHILAEPGERGSGTVISSITPEDELARNWQRLIMTHLEEKEHTGVLAGYPVTDIRLTLAAGRAHDKHTSGGDFREAVYRAVRNALMQAKRAGHAVLLEPWYEYEIELPSQAVGRAMTDIQQMGGTQDGLEQSGDTARLRGRVPASEIGDYQQTLISYTSGLGRLTCTPAGYYPCHNADEVIETAGYDPERDTDNPADSVFVSHGGTDIVKWDEVPEHMHIPSVLRRRQDGGTGYGSLEMTGYGSGAVSDSKDKDARAAAEKELKLIFERTYGAPKGRIRKDAREERYGSTYEATEKTPEQQAADDLRNSEVRARHERKRPAGTSDERLLILIDGYNLIHADQYLTELASEDMGAARDQLIERLCNYAAYTGNEVTAVFDAYNVAGGEGHEEDILGVRVIFTSEDEPADIRIGLMTSEVKGRKVYVVSSDMLVQQDSLGHGAMRISSREFMRLLESTEADIRAELSRQ